ncbi:MAG: class I SAM-dependent methyltransferase [Anaerolineaceae bacterium]|nr:class I SAM-dependent methyltransferase [Anaerolineaceae bacterium]
MNLESKHYGRNYYEGIFSRSSHNSQRNRNRLEVILSNKREGKLLEIGCGKGEFLQLAAEHFQVEGIDISEYAVDSSKYLLNGRVRKEDIETSRLRANTYNVIAGFNVLEHLSKPGYAIHNIYNALENEGLFIGSVPYNATLIGKGYTALTNIFDPTHCSTYPPHRWDFLFKKIGFKKISYFGEVLLGKNLNAYLKNRYWNFLSLNMMFLCEK